MTVGVSVLVADPGASKLLTAALTLRGNWVLRHKWWVQGPPPHTLRSEVLPEVLKRARRPLEMLLF